MRASSLPKIKVFANPKRACSRSARFLAHADSRCYSYVSFRILLPTTKAGALQSSHTTRYSCVIWPCHIFGPSDVLIVPCAPFEWESPCWELIFSTRVPVRSAAEDCSVCERMVGLIKSSRALVIDGRHHRESPPVPTHACDTRVAGPVITTSGSKSARSPVARQLASEGENAPPSKSPGIRLGGVEACATRLSE
jgi:hypothetical protein